MSDNRNLLLAVVLSVTVLLGWQFFFQPAGVEQPAETASGESASGTTDNAAGVAAPSGQAPSGEVAAPSLEGGPQAVSNYSPMSRSEALAQTPRLSFDSPRVDGSISLRGARFDDLQLKQYRETVDPTSPEIHLLSPRGSEKPYYARFGWSSVASAGVKVPGHDALWTQETPGDLTPENPVTLAWDNGEGVTFRLKIELDDAYMFDITQSVTNNSGRQIELSPYGQVAREGTPETSGIYILHEGLLGYFPGEGQKQIDYDDLAEDGMQKFSATGGWLGITDKYWMTALIPDQSAEIRASFDDSRLRGTDVYHADYLRGPVAVPPGETVAVTDRLFAGAKVVDIVDAYEEDLGIESFDLVIDWGWFYFITKPLFKALQFFAEHVGNFGIAILIVTVIIKAFFFPLANTSYVAMSRMKKVQPEMTKIRERFKDDKVRQQQEMMELYKREKVNPLAGCLPILIQIPVFFALYKVLYVTIEMRHAPFFGWIQDLSAHDPTSIFNLFGLIPWEPPLFLAIGVWPIIMGITMYLQMKMNPAPADEIQQKIFTWMPVFFTFILAKFPAGLVIYWTWNNSLSIAQQWVIMRRQGVSPEWGKEFAWVGNLVRRVRGQDDTA